MIVRTTSPNSHREVVPTNLVSHVRPIGPSDFVTLYPWRRSSRTWETDPDLTVERRSSGLPAIPRAWGSRRPETSTSIGERSMTASGKRPAATLRSASNRLERAGVDPQRYRALSAFSAIPRAGYSRFRSHASDHPRITRAGPACHLANGQRGVTGESVVTATSRCELRGWKPRTR
jgi:hypothetical protein